MPNPITKLSAWALGAGRTDERLSERGGLLRSVGIPQAAELNRCLRLPPMLVTARSSGRTAALGYRATLGKAVRVFTIALATWAVPGAQTIMAADTPEVSEQQVKAAFLINFPKYVDWPTDALAETNSPIVVAVLGETDLDVDLQKMLKGKTINGHPMVFKRVATEEECAKGCHILFIGDEAARRVSEILGKLDGTSILTVGDSEDFLDSGGVIKLAKRDRKIRLEVNLTAANRARLKLSSKLLSVADVVRGNRRGGGG